MKDFESRFPIDLGDLNYSIGAENQVSQQSDNFVFRVPLLKTLRDSCLDFSEIGVMATDERDFFKAAHNLSHEIEDNFPSKN